MTDCERLEMLLRTMDLCEDADHRSPSPLDVTCSTRNQPSSTKMKSDGIEDGDSRSLMLLLLLRFKSCPLNSHSRSLVGYPVTRYLMHQ